MSGLMAEIARTYSEEMAVTAGDEKEEDTNAVIERINGVIVQNINKKFAAEEEENADQINPSNQQFLSSNQPVSKTEAAPLNNGRFQAEFKKTNEPYKFYYSREEISRMNKKNINEEILDIYMRSLVAFSQDVDVETLNKHIYYLQNDGQWVDDNNQ
ncbi:hypothetical protein ECANGB1_806 [Enterospora canceri]|nr:hypothetical protein ECANGB1_806 [Enterospora canceri]